MLTNVQPQSAINTEWTKLATMITMNNDMYDFKHVRQRDTDFKMFTSTIRKILMGHFRTALKRNNMRLENILYLWYLSNGINKNLYDIINKNVKHVSMFNEICGEYVIIEVIPHDLSMIIPLYRITIKLQEM